MLNLSKNPNHWFIESFPIIGSIYKDNIFGDYWQCIGYSTVDGTKFEFLYNPIQFQGQKVINMNVFLKFYDQNGVMVDDIKDLSGDDIIVACKHAIKNGKTGKFKTLPDKTVFLWGDRITENDIIED